MRARASLLLLLGWIAAPAGAETFVDVTAAAGLAFTHHTPNDPPDCLFAEIFCEPERMSGGVAVGDVDGDGLPDLYFTRLEAPGVLFRNDGDGTFTDVTAGSGLDAFAFHGNGAAFVDVDRDGDLDLYVTSIASTRFHLYVNDGTGAFSEEAVARGAAVDTGDPHLGWSVAVGDYDRDGYPDLYVGEWRPAGTTGPSSISHSRLLRNRGAAEPGHFDDVTLAAGVAPEGVYPSESWVFAPAFVDLDLDGWQDLALANDFGTSLLFWNQGDGTFLEDTVGAGVGSDENGMGSAFGDYDGDGDLDWFVTSIFDPDETCELDPCNWGYTGNRLYRYEGGRVFSDATDDAGVRDGHWGWGTTFFDSDNDGDLDLVMTNGVDFPAGVTGAEAAFEEDPMRFWRNDGLGGYTEVSAAVGLTDTGSGKGLLAFDHDDDGDLDVLLVNNVTGPKLYENVGGNANAWLRVRAVHHDTGSPALGARIEIEPVEGGPVQVREVGAEAHFLSHPDAVAHFGLGPAAGDVHRVTVRFLGSFSQSFYLVAPNQTLVIDDRWVRCGLLGIEPFVVLGLLRRWRRRA